MTTCHRMGSDPGANRSVKEDDMALGCEPVASTNHDAAVHRYDHLTKGART